MFQAVRCRVSLGFAALGLRERKAAGLVEGRRGVLL